MRKLKAFAEIHSTMPAYIGSIGMFNCFDAKGWEWYCPDRWVPHCTIALTGEDGEDAFFRASDLLLHEFKKLSGTLVTCKGGMQDEYNNRRL